MRPLARMTLTLLLALFGTVTGLCLFFILAQHFSTPNWLRSQMPPCFEIGAPFHHRFRPNCQEEVQTPQGPIRFATNEQGLRERSSAEIQQASRKILVLGDSYVEGWWLSADQTLSARLEKEFPGRAFINGGLRSTGPLFQARIFGALADAYRPQAALWVLNGTDPADDRLACALLENPSPPSREWEFSVRDFEQSPAEKWLVGLLGDSNLGRQAKFYLYYRRWKNLTGSASRCEPCRGIKEVATEAKRRRIKLGAVFLKVPWAIGPYPQDEQGTESLLACARQEGILLQVEEWKGLSELERESSFWAGDAHLNPQGVRSLINSLGPVLSKWLPPAQ